MMTRATVFLLFKFCLSIKLVSTQVSSTIPVSIAPQCSEYKIIDDPTRNVNANGASNCDQSTITSPTWVRFVGEGGTEIPTSPTSPDRCGAQATGWYNGSMPNDPYTTQNGTACFNWANAKCQWPTNIQVTNCGSFYVYLLGRPSACNLRYCTDKSTIISTTSTTTTASTTVILSQECFAYTTIDDPTRNVNANGALICDAQFGSGSTWVRFVGSSGTQLTTSPTRPNECGTQVTGWYSGQMPTMSDTTINGTVCFAWLTDSCQWSNNIRVTNCGSFFVYQLPLPPLCSARYCTDDSSHTTTTSTTSSTSVIVSSQCSEYAIIDDVTRGVHRGTGTVCDKELFNSTPTWIRFVGEGGTRLPTSPTSPNQCGTAATGWYSGQMPSAPYTTINGTACFSWGTNTCTWSTDMLVTRCGSFYVYQLNQPPICTARYCTERESSSASWIVSKLRRLLQWIPFFS